MLGLDSPAPWGRDSSGTRTSDSQAAAPVVLRTEASNKRPQGGQQALHELQQKARSALNHSPFSECQDPGSCLHAQVNSVIPEITHSFICQTCGQAVLCQVQSLGYEDKQHLVLLSKAP